MDENLHEIARQTAKATVQETFLALGVDMHKPGEMIEVQQDFAWTRASRLTARKLRMHAITVGVAIATSGVVWAVWHAIITAKATTGH